MHLNDSNVNEGFLNNLTKISKIILALFSFKLIINLKFVLSEINLVGNYEATSNLKYFKSIS